MFSVGHLAMRNTAMYFRDAPFVANQDMYFEKIVRLTETSITRMNTD